MSPTIGRAVCQSKKTENQSKAATVEQILHVLEIFCCCFKLLKTSIQKSVLCAFKDSDSTPNIFEQIPAAVFHIQSLSATLEETL